eukprot:scaffold650_cov249-Pinguiococcus_pyrenoidosus.AAC.9
MHFPNFKVRPSRAPRRSRSFSRKKSASYAIGRGSSACVDGVETASSAPRAAPRPSFAVFRFAAFHFSPLPRDACDAVENVVESRVPLASLAARKGSI